MYVFMSNFIDDKLRIVSQLLNSDNRQSRPLQVAIRTQLSRLDKRIKNTDFRTKYNIFFLTWTLIIFKQARGD
jgi:hypothetical protein